MSDTRLLYSFTTTPNPVVVSIGGDSPVPSNIDLLVMIDNPGKAVTDVESITIVIPVGAGTQSSTSDPSTDGNRLSDAKDLPQPDYDHSGPWKIEVAGSTVTITPKQTPGTMVSTLMFTLRNITVNEAIGIVPINVTERAPTPITARFQITKLDANFPVKDFYAEYNGARLNPPVLYDLDQTVTLKWVCSTQGESKAYNLRQLNDNSWETDGLSCSDGRTGVATQNLHEASTFALDVLNPDGTTIDTLFLTVRLALPVIASNSFIKKYFSGRIIALHWVASNSAKCIVEMNGNQIDGNAPTDTYHDGYILVINDGPGTYMPSIVANARTGNAQDNKVFDPVHIAGPLVTRNVGRQFMSMAITPDGSRVLGTEQSDFFGLDGFGADWVTMLDVATGALTQITVGNSCSRLAITPDGKLALVLNHIWERTGKHSWEKSQCNVSVIDIPSGTARPNTIPVGTKPNDIAITPDGKFALVSDFGGSLSVINLATLAVDRTINSVGSGAQAVGITPDGKLALVTNNEAKVTVIDLSTFTVQPNAVPTDANDKYPADIAITPDSKFALIANLGSVRVIDIANRRAEPLIPVGSGGSTIAITPDGRFAIVTNFGDNVVKVIRIADRHATPIDMPVGPGVPAVVISRDGSTAVLATENWTVTLL